MVTKKWPNTINETINMVTEKWPNTINVTIDMVTEKWPNTIITKCYFFHFIYFFSL